MKPNVSNYVKCPIMRKKRKLKFAMWYTVLLLAVTGTVRTYAQVLPVGTHLLEEKYRRDQLLGLVDSTVSFTIRPLTAMALGRDNVFGRTDSTESKSIIYVTPDARGYVQLM